MLSSDQNVETIAELIEALKHYLGLQTEYVKLDVIDKVVRLLTIATITFIVFFIVLLMLIYVSFAIAYALAPVVGTVWAFVIVAGVYLLLLILFVIKRRSWIEKPLVRFLANLLLSK